MSYCLDWPCCGHEPGCCPDFDADGNQLNMKCICGATVPITSRYSLCSTCLTTPEPSDYPDDGAPFSDGFLYYDDGYERFDEDEENFGL